MNLNDPKAPVLEFSPVAPEDYDRIFPFTSRYGEGSCQLSPVSMFSLSEKYGDSVCVRNGVLYTFRKNLCDESFRVYLAPLGDDARSGYASVLSDAAAYGKRVRFESLTEAQASLLEEVFPGRFRITEDRDLAEYMYRTEIMSSFPGRSNRKRRYEVNAFRTQYGERASAEVIRPGDYGEILSFARDWVRENASTHDAEALEREERMIGKQMAHFEALRLSGVVLRIDGVIKGFSYGTKLSDEFYDTIAEKADRNIPHIYKVLRAEATKQCCMDCRYVNYEEDLGIPGLRYIKTAYRPEFLLNKYIAAEKE